MNSSPLVKRSIQFFLRCYRPIYASDKNPAWKSGTRAGFRRARYFCKNLYSIAASVLLTSTLRAQVPSLDASTKPDASFLALGGTLPVEAQSSPPDASAEAKPVAEEPKSSDRTKLRFKFLDKDGKAKFLDQDGKPVELPPTPHNDVGISFNPGLLKDIVDAIERRIPNWPQRGSWKMPNVVFGNGTENARILGPIIMHEVTPLQALTLVAAAADCVLEPIEAITEEERSQYAKGQVIGYRFVIEATRTGRTAMEHPTEQRYTKLELSTAANNQEEEIIRLARERLEQTRQLYKANRASASKVDEAEGELALAEARGDLIKRAEARLTMATKYLERLEGVHSTGNISDAEYNEAKQRKLEAELALQSARADSPAIK